MILLGELKPGSRLRQAETAALLGTSTTPVREAFAALAREGLIRQDAHRGAVVAAPTLTDLYENYDLLFRLEPLATEVAAMRIDASGLAELEALVDELARAPLADPARRVELNDEFHRTIIETARRPRLAELVLNLRDVLAGYVMLLTREQKKSTQELEEIDHRAILEALRAGDAAASAAAMERHLRRGAEDIAAVMTRASGPSPG